jgi:hypothetical protein
MSGDKYVSVVNHSIAQKKNKTSVAKERSWHFAFHPLPPDPWFHWLGSQFIHNSRLREIPFNFIRRFCFSKMLA